MCALPPHSVVNVRLVNLPARATQEGSRKNAKPAGPLLCTTFIKSDFCARTVQVALRVVNKFNYNNVSRAGPTLKYFYYVQILLHRFPLLFLPLAGVVFCIYRVQRKSNHSKIYSLSPLRYHQSPHICSHILRGGTFLLFSCRALVRNKSGTTELDTGPNTEESKPEGRLTRGRACRKLGGAGSSPRNTSIVETLRDFSIAYRHHAVKQQRARTPCRS